MANYKVMFWNVQNIYEQKTITPDEIGLESGVASTKKTRVEKNSKKLYETNDTNHRGSVADIVLTNDIDVFVLVEVSVGKEDLQIGAFMRAKSIHYEHFGVDNLLVALNERGRHHQLGKQSGPSWVAARSSVNASDLTAIAAAHGISITSKNTMFEQYAIFWRTNKFTYVPPPGLPQTKGPVSPAITIMKTSEAGSPLPFPQRFPGSICLAEKNAPFGQMTIVMHHSVWGDSPKPRTDTIGYLAQLPGVAGTTGLPKLVLAGDFNVDYIAQSSAYAPITSLPGMVVRNGPRATSSVSAEATTLKNAYDQMFTRDLTPAGIPPTGEGPFNFAVHVFNEDWNKARRISDHLPIVATISLP